MAGRIYNTAQWKRLRALKLAASPLCEECLQGGRVKPAMAVDHVVPVRLGGPEFPPLNGLRSLCLRCHNQKTARGPEAGAVRTTKPVRGCDADGRPLDAAHPWSDKPKPPLLARPSGLRRSAIPLTIVCGPPGGGKSTWVRERAGPNDVVIDLDDFMVQASGLPRYSARRWHVAPALELRNAALMALAHDKVHDRAYFIVGAPTQEERKWWQRQLGGELVLVAPPLEECVRRISADPERARNVARMVRAAEEWWQAQHTNHTEM